MRLGLDHFKEARVDKIEEKRLICHKLYPENLTTGTKSVCNIGRVNVILELDSADERAHQRQIAQLLNRSRELIVE